MSKQKNGFLKIVDFLSERVPFHNLNFEHMVTKKEVPVHRMSWAYYMGGLPFYSF